MSTTTAWTARVEWPEPEPDETRIDHILDRLEGRSAVIAPAATAGLLEATISIDAATLRQAFAEAVAAVESATGIKATGVEVLPEGVHDERVAQPLVPELVGAADIARMAGVSRQRAAQLADLDGFPPAVVHVGSGGALRVKAHVETWLHGWQRKPGRPTVSA